MPASVPRYLCAVQAGRQRCGPVPSPEDLAAMYAASPVVYVDAVKAPVFMMLGAKDRRVPPPDGLQYLSALRGRDVAAHGAPPESRLIVFPEVRVEVVVLQVPGQGNNTILTHSCKCACQLLSILCTRSPQTGLAWA